MSEELTVESADAAMATLGIELVAQLTNMVVRDVGADLAQCGAIARIEERDHPGKERDCLHIEADELVWTLSFSSNKHAGRAKAGAIHQVPWKAMSRRYSGSSPTARNSTGETDEQEVHHWLAVGGY